MGTFEKIRTFGLKGIADYIKGRIYSQQLSKALAANVARYPQKPAKGVTLLADFSGKHSLSKVMRDLAFNLQRVDIPFQAINTNTSNTPPDDFARFTTKPQDIRLAKYDHIIEMFSHLAPTVPGVHHAKIVFWEFESGLLEFDQKLDDGTDILAMSDFCANVFQKTFVKSKHVHKLPYPFQFPPQDIEGSSTIRKRYGLNKEDFVVFFNFDFGSSFNRKNPDATLQAFATAFHHCPDAKLVFKTMRSKQYPDKVQALTNHAAKLGIANQFTLIESYIPQADLYGLTNACDVYMSLHRGEGFGLGIAEAMSLGKPVIVTDYSAPTEFCKSKTSIAVPYRLVPVSKDRTDNPNYRFVKSWAEPDVDAAAKALRQLYEDPRLRTTLGNNAKTFITNYFSVENFKKSVEVFLDS